MVTNEPTCTSKNKRRGNNLYFIWVCLKLEILKVPPYKNIEMTLPREGKNLEIFDVP